MYINSLFYLPDFSLSIQLNNIPMSVSLHDVILLFRLECFVTVLRGYILAIYVILVFSLTSFNEFG